jgi:hypothetical protein
MPSKGFEVFYVFCETFLAISGVLGNGFIIFVFMRDENLKKKVKNTFLIYLAIGDFFTALIGVPFCIMVAFIILFLSAFEKRVLILDLLWCTKKLWLVFVCVVIANGMLDSFHILTDSDFD